MTDGSLECRWKTTSGRRELVRFLTYKLAAQVNPLREAGNVGQVLAQKQTPASADEAFVLAWVAQIDSVEAALERIVDQVEAAV